MDIGKGDFVECMNNTALPGTRWFFPEDVLSVGVLYRVRDCFEAPDGASILVDGHERQRSSARFGYRVGYGVERFRPVYRPNAQLLQSLLTNIPEGVE